MERTHLSPKIVADRPFSTRSDGSLLRSHAHEMARDRVELQDQMLSTGKASGSVAMAVASPSAVREYHDGVHGVADL